MKTLTLMPRRKFVQSTMAASAAVASGVVVVGCGNDVEPAPSIDATVDDDRTSPSYGQIRIRVDKVAQLETVGGAVTVRLQQLPADPSRGYAQTDAVLVARVDQGTYVAVDSACPHAGCPLGYSQKDALIECPCHGSKFQPAPIPGACSVEVVHLPSVQGPRAYDAQLFDNTLVITLKPPGGAMPKASVVNGALTLPIAQFPSLAQPGGTQLFNCGELGGYFNPVVIVRKDPSTFVALDATCTHQACAVAYTPGPNDLECPCHGSRFALDGSVQHGPATRPLKTFTTSFDGTNLHIKVA